MGRILSLLVKFLPFPVSGGLLAGIAVAFAAGASAGGWAVWKLSKADQVASLEKHIELIERNRAASLDALENYYERQLTIERGRVRTVEVERYVPDNRACDLSADAVGLLDRSRLRLPETTGRTAEATAGSSADGILSQRDEIRAHADCGERYRQAQSRIQALREWFKTVETGR